MFRENHFEDDGNHLTLYYNCGDCGQGPWTLDVSEDYVFDPNKFPHINCPAKPLASTYDVSCGKSTDTIVGATIVWDD